MGRAWQGLAEEFAKAGHDVTVVARAFHGQAAAETFHGFIHVMRSALADPVFGDRRRDTHEVLRVGVVHHFIEVLQSRHPR